jgi:HEAT repeats
MPKTAGETSQDLAALWRKIQLAQASEQERIDAAFLTGDQHAHAFLPQVKNLLHDDAEMVRYFALQALVLDLKEKTPQAADVAWRLLETDPSEDVRSMAATCLSSIYFGQKRRDIFDRFAKILRNDREGGHVKGSVYSALHQLAGLPPREWPGLWGPRKVFEESDIDWGTVAALEDTMR